MTGSSSLLPPVLPPVQPASDEGEREVISQETAGLSGPAHLVDLPPHHQVRTALSPQSQPGLRTVVHTAIAPGQPRVHDDEETLAIFRTG